MAPLAVQVYHPAIVHNRISLPLLTILLSACSHASPPAPPPAAPAAAPTPEAIVSDPDRTEADRKLDAGRKPAEMLRFLKVQPGMKVAELFAGGGYTTELLARAVGPTGTVYGQNTKPILERFAEKPWSARLARPINKNVVRLDRDLEDPFPAEVRDLDLVVSNIIYHDTVWIGADRQKMNAAVFAALKSGGRYVVCDSSAKPGTGVEAAKTLHRIDETVVRNEVPAAGFKLVEEGNFLRNPADPRDWNSSPGAAGEKRGTSDRFCLAFQKP
jgi:predicted methyltransferase